MARGKGMITANVEHNYKGKMYLNICFDGLE